MKARRYAWLLLLSTNAFAAGDNPYLAQAKTLYDALEFERCLERIKQAKAWDSSAAERIEVEMYAGLCAISVGRESEARDAFQVVVRLCPTCTVAKFTSPRIVALFDEVAKDVNARAPVKVVPPVAATTPPSALAPVSVAAQVPVRSWWVPSILAGAAVAATGVGAGFGVASLNQERQAKVKTYEVDMQREGDWARASARNANISYGVAGAFAVAAVVSYFLTAPPEPAADKP